MTDLRRDGSPHRPVGYDGMTATEREVMALFDKGAGVKNIQFITGKSFEQVRNIVSVLGVTAHEPWKDDARLGSAALLAALRRVHPDRAGKPSA